MTRREERPERAPFDNESGAVAYVQEELEHGVPAGWSFSPAEGTTLGWLIEKREVKAGEWPTQDFQLFLSMDLQFLHITFGNDDAGPLSVRHCLLNAKVIPTTSLRFFPLRALLREVFAQCAPNEWGYT